MAKRGEGAYRQEDRRAHCGAEAGGGRKEKKSPLELVLRLS